MATQLEKLHKSLQEQLELIKALHEDNLAFHRLLIEIAKIKIIKIK